MLIYNVTVQIDPEIAPDWLAWMQEVHIPEVLATGMFLSHELFRVMDDEEATQTYAMQYRCAGLPDLLRYQTEFAPALQAAHRRRYEGRFIAFRTLLEALPLKDECVGRSNSF
jgi:hypothetical protein